MSREAEIREALKQWIAGKSGKIRAEEIADDTPILGRRLITSLQVMDLILKVEELSGKPIDASRLKPGVFKNIDAIYETFFEGG